MYKAIIFDIDGVIITGHARFSDRFSKEFGVDSGLVGEFFKAEFGKCLIGESDLKEVIKPYLEDWGWQGTTDDLLQFWFEGESNVDSKIINFIQGLDKSIIKIGGSNQEIYRGEHIKNELGMSKLLDYVYVSGELGVKKPDLEFYRKILQLSNLEDSDATDILYLDDDPENVEAGRRFGLESHLYEDYEKFAKEYENNFS